jgi:ornithine decarboxylase
MTDLLEAPVWEERATPAVADEPRVGTLDPNRWVVAEAHDTPAEIMKRDLPQRVHALVAMHGTPLLVIDRARLVQEFRAFRRLLPRVRLYYAVKANPHPDVIRTFAELGGCFDVASEGEMRHVLGCGVGANRLIFANTVKRPEALTFAKKVGADFVTFDSEPELYKIAKHAPGCRVLCRARVGNAASQVNLSLKFGADSEQVVPLLLKARSLGLKAEGISFHVGSQCSDYDSYLRAFETTSALVGEAARR